MTTKTCGAKYESTKALTTVQVAALVRKDIKAAVASGELPAGTYSVRTQTYSLGSSIDIRWIVPTIRVFNAAHLRWEVANPFASFSTAPQEAKQIASAEAASVEAKLEAILATYNRVEVDFASDYHNVRFHWSVDPNQDWEIARREMELEAATAAPEVEPAPSQAQWLNAMGAL